MSRIALMILLACYSQISACFGVETSWHIGFAKEDITPLQALRLSGYGARERAFESVADRLYCRAMALSNSARDADAMIMVSVDSIAVTAELTNHVARFAEEAFGIPRSQLVISSTHSHAAPHVHAGLQNLFRVPLTNDEKLAIKANTDNTIERIKTAIRQALQNRKPAVLSIGEGQATFAVNRRVLKGGLWSAFGIQADGPVDHRVRVMRANDQDGKLLGAVFMYACHCTTLGPDFNRVSGDWAGLAASQLESENRQAVVLASIGCGADANPHPRTGYEDAKKHAGELASAVNRVLTGTMQPLTSFPVGRFGYAGLAPEIPTREHLKQMAEDGNVANRNWAAAMTEIWNKMGRLPETYPAPIHTWQFGNQLTWVFLGGEVVIDYQMGLERTLPEHKVWVSAYTDDVFAYVASERMRAEGGYEVDFSMIYYQQPGRWQSGTEQLIYRRVQEVLADNQAEDKPRAAEAALKSIRVPSGFQVDLLAAEPLTTDPINLAFGHDGKIWVVEMADYPLGSSSAGRVRWLKDSDGDGRLDQAQLFLEGIDYPTGVCPWRDGIIVLSSPDIFFAKDTDGDGRADRREVLLTGVHPANPQHRASGFELGLDGWLYFGAGDGTRELFSSRNGQTYAGLSGRDVAWNPDSGEIRPATGHTQFCRARDEWDNWYGNSNSQPIFQYMIDERYLRGRSLGGPAVQHLLDPPTAPPVFPVSRTVDRFNDLFAFNRFTSACSSIICRVPGLGPSMRGAAIVCEPVHNLVARFQVETTGVVQRASRFTEDAQQDWYASTDAWSRPVRVVNAPDGTIWIADMVRRVIEHPQWIPTAWQQRFDLRSGEKHGRIYRIRRQDFAPQILPDLTKLSSQELVVLLSDDNSAVRDLAQYQLLWRSVAEQEHAAGSIAELIQHSDNPAVRIQALGFLLSAGLMKRTDILQALQDSDPRVVRFGIRCSEELAKADPTVLVSVAKVAQRNLGPVVDLQLLLTLGQFPDDSVQPALGEVVSRAVSNPWSIRATTTVADFHAATVVHSLLAGVDRQSEISATDWSELENGLNRLLPRLQKEERLRLVAERFTPSAVSAAISNSQLLILGGLATSNSQARNRSDNSSSLREANGPEMDQAVDQAYQLLAAPQTNAELRSRLVNLIGHGWRPLAAEIDVLKRLVAPNQPPEIQQKALLAAGRLSDVSVADLLISVWPSMTADARRTICSTLLRRKEWVDRMLSALEKGAIRVADLDVASAQQLRSSGDRNMMNRAEKVLGKPANSDKAKLVQSYIDQIPKTLDRSRGELLYREHCAVCHQSNSGKPLIGPPLENLKHWTTDQWFVAVLDPNRNIEPKYHQYSVITDEGQVFVGIIEHRSGATIQLASSDGTRREIPLALVEDMKDAGISLMPEGMEGKLSPSQLADLVQFLRTKN